jgi:hypothetical protein
VTCETCSIGRRAEQGSSPVRSGRRPLGTPTALRGCKRWIREPRSRPIPSPGSSGTSRSRWCGRCTRIWVRSGIAQRWWSTGSSNTSSGAADRLQRLGLVGPSVTGKVTAPTAGPEKEAPRNHKSDGGVGSLDAWAMRDLNPRPRACERCALVVQIRIRTHQSHVLWVVAVSSAAPPEGRVYRPEDTAHRIQARI